MKDEDIVATIPGWTYYKIYTPAGVPVYHCSSPKPDIRMPRWLVFFLGFAIGFLIWWILAPVVCHGKQMQPDSKRIREIQAALIDHNYAPGKTWKETQDILRGIARMHHWQTHWAPDARVLILLGLSNNDPQIIDGERNRLDGGTSEVEN